MSKGCDPLLSVEAANPFTRVRSPEEREPAPPMRRDCTQRNACGTTLFVGWIIKDNAGVRFCHGKPESAASVPSIPMSCKGHPCNWQNGRGVVSKILPAANAGTTIERLTFIRCPSRWQPQFQWFVQQPRQQRQLVVIE